MKVRVTKTADRPEIIATRDDGVRVSLRTPTRKFSPPHDLIHLIVEQELLLGGGFWGSVANGAKFSSLQVVGGRQRPKAKERSTAVLKANKKNLSEAEMIVGAFQSVLHENLEPPIAQLNRMLRGGGFKIDDEALRRTWDALLVLRDQWEDLGMGVTLELQWVSPQKKSRSSKR